MITALIVCGFLIAVFLSGVFSGGETGLYCLSQVRLKVQAEQGDRRARRLERLLHHAPSALSMALIGTNLMNYLATAFFALLMTTQLGLGEGQTEIYTTLIVTFIIFVFGEVVPKNLFQSHPDRFMSAVAPILRTANLVLFPAVWAMTWATGRFAGLFGKSGAVQAGLDPRVQVARLLRDEMIASPHVEVHHEMIERALALADLPVHRVMTPRNRVAAIAASARRERLQSLARTKGHSILPVFGRNPRRIEGIVEVAKLLDDEHWTTIGERMAPATCLDPHESVAAALIHLQRERARMGIVVDRGGYLLGLVTLKDLVEELVGELPAW